MSKCHRKHWVKKRKRGIHRDDNNVIRPTLNTIAGGFAKGEQTSSTSRRYARQVLNIEDLPKELNQGEPKILQIDINFFKDTIGIHPHNEDPMVITIRCDQWEIRRVLIDQGTSTDILYWDVFERFHLDPDDLKPFKGC